MCVAEAEKTWDDRAPRWQHARASPNRCPRRLRLRGPRWAWRLLRPWLSAEAAPGSGCASCPAHMRAMARPAVLAALCLAALSSHCAWAAGQSPRGDRFMNSGCVWHLRLAGKHSHPRADSPPAGAVSNRQGSQRATDKCTFVYKARHHAPACSRSPGPVLRSPARRRAGRLAAPPRVPAAAAAWPAPPRCWFHLLTRLNRPTGAGQEAGLHLQASRQSECLQPGAGQPDGVLQAECAGRTVHHVHLVVAGVFAASMRCGDARVLPHGAPRHRCACV